MAQERESRYTPPLEAALHYRPRSIAEAIEYLDGLEHVWRTVRANERDDGMDELLVASCEKFIMRWAHLNARLLPVGRYRATIERYEARQSLGWSQRIYELGTMWSIARYAGDFREPALLKDERSKLPEYQPLAELILYDPVDETLLVGGLWPGDRLIVHLGHLAYRGALVIASCQVEPEPNERKPPLRHFLARILEPEKYNRGAVLKIAEGGDETVVLTRRGGFTVECVIFNRPDLLSR